MDILRDEKIGQTLTRNRLLSRRHLNNILTRQKHGDSRKFGQIAVDLKYLDPGVMSKYLRLLNKKTLKTLH